eukprot:TRINITY_DN3711_c0_g1_i1.p1 TRINITY_DN3711_c0_g1~~TRINITY_DN3711_c0_g1_i1.p1  ORF type:complete len:178 (+),score=14.08 TRINITY_DN3711_c0_g1_i1:24-557(+)
MGGRIMVLAGRVILVAACFLIACALASPARSLRGIANSSDLRDYNNDDLTHAASRLLAAQPEQAASSGRRTSECKWICIEGGNTTVHESDPGIAAGRQCGPVCEPTSTTFSSTLSSSTSASWTTSSSSTTLSTWVTTTTDTTSATITSMTLSSTSFSSSSTTLSTTTFSSTSTSSKL